MFWGFVTVAVTFCDCFCWSGMRPHGWRICFCHCPTIGKIPVSQQSISQSVSQSVSWSSVFNYVMLIAGKFYGMMLLQSF